MHRERNFRTAFAAIAVALGQFINCTGYIEQPEAGGAAAAASSASQSDTGAGTAKRSGQVDRAGLRPQPVSVAWQTAVGTWCGPAAERSLWLTAKPVASACDAASHKLYSDAEDASEGVTLSLDPLALASLPAVLDVPARYCGPDSVCSDLRATLRVESYTPGQGIRGSWSVSPPGHAELDGSIDASWCSWDDFLPAHPDADRLARDITLREVSVYQGVKVPIVRDLRAVSPRNADLVQEREALLRVFVEPGPGFQPRPLSARITLQDADGKPRHFEQTIEVSGASSEAVSSSTFNLELPKDAFHETTQYSVELREVSRCTELSGTPLGARFPEAGLAPVAARYTGPVKVVLVPVRYQSDGSGRLPDTSPEQLADMTRRLYSMYPTNEVVLSLHAPVETTRTDLADMLDQMRELRVSEAPATDVSYYGLVRQAETFADYCQGSCTTGIAGFGSQSGVAAVGVGVGFTEAAAGTFVHELGHIHRRPHAPCGSVSAPDETYPYADAGLGSWGYDFGTRELFDPGTHVDFMSYCSPAWISDYNYQLILERIILVNRHAGAVFRRVAPPGAPTAFRTLRVTKNGLAHWGLDLHPDLEPPGDPVNLEALDAQGAVLTEFPATFEDGPDGEQSFFVPAGQVGWQAVRVPGGPTLAYDGASQNEPFKR